ncbi:NAD-dependent epimerase/dehydratase family protein [Parvularcula lutaonensis]|uniref:NAD-dependent epimerase/dehydratase family protein n=1 Tax=Parvularcula lutaonensis TaxID=491923 RepID=A0ABV7MBY6_9PROT|nr:NAD-dependent epimerase/dehydratase family protein [Parvularcula lutaonensis]GGY49425.1 hypothetical protein GCM10007148_17430 [Parvularcula lutaonensis]
MSDALIGYTGFVGGNLDRQHAFAARYNSANISDIAGTEIDTLVFAGAQGKKWWANQNPDEDWRSIEKALAPLRQASVRRLILISTIDVLPPGPGHDETTDCSKPQHAYGRNRFRLEEELKAMIPDTTVVRLPGLFGEGLKKNVIYDLLTDNMLEKINPASSFQYYDLTRLWQDICTTLDAGIRLIHFFPEPLGTQAILDAFFPDKAVGSAPYPEAHYDYRTIHDGFFGGRDGYMLDTDEVLEDLSHFIETARAKT